MTKTKVDRAWVTRTDVSEWAIRYLERRCIRVPDSPPAKVLYERLCHIDTLKGRTPENLKLLERMKSAWRKQQSRRSQTVRKGYSFDLSKEAGMQLRRLAADYGETNARTLELIISNSLAQENSRKTEDKEEGVYKKRAAIFERQLDQALNEIHEHKLRLSEAGIDIATSLSMEQQKKIQSLARSRKNDVISQLPQLPVRKSGKLSTRAKTSDSKKRNQPEPSTSKGEEAASEMPEQVRNVISTTGECPLAAKSIDRQRMRAGSDEAYLAVQPQAQTTIISSASDIESELLVTMNPSGPLVTAENTSTAKITAGQGRQEELEDAAECADHAKRAGTLRQKEWKIELRIKKPFEIKVKK